MDITIRAARAEEYERVGDLIADAYQAGGLLRFGAGDGYLAVIRDTAGRAAQAEVLVAEAGDGELLGSVTFAAPGTPFAELQVPRTGEFRMLAVSAAARGRGVGEALVRACVDRCRRLGCTHLALSMQSQLVQARRLYERLGFRRTPARDWRPLPEEPDLVLLAYELPVG